MKKLLFFILLISTAITAQKKDITLEEIWSGAFRTEYMNELNAMDNGFYSLLDIDYNNRSTAINKYNYKTLEKVETIVNSKSIKDINYFESYTFNKNETQLLLGTKIEPIYRHSTLGYYYTYHIATKKATLIDVDKIQEPTFSPDSKKVAYVKNNNIYLKNLENNTITQVTFDGKKNKIINGITDWVYEEEFSFVKAFEWSTDSKHIAFLKFNETEVPSYSMKVIGTNLYPTQTTFKYPKAGEKNSKVSLHIYKLKNQKTNKINLGEYEYIPRLKWTKNANIVSVQTLNRHQNNLNLFFVDVTSSKAKVILNEKSKTYVNAHFNLTFLKDNSFIWTSENDGWNHIYHYASNGKFVQQITKGNWEVTNFYGINEDTKTIYYQSTQDGSINRSVHSINLSGTNSKKLNTNLGTNTASFSKNFNYYINTFSSATTPPIYTLHNNKGKELKKVITNKKIAEKLLDYKLGKKEFFTLKTSKEQFNAYLIKPSNFNASKKYPLLIYQYSGPGSQSVSNSWNGYNDYWHYMLAEQGVLVACVDTRGTGQKGNAFKTITYQQLGKYEVIDLVDAAVEFGKKSFIDKNNIGIWGWSYGGFMSANCILKGNTVFKAAISVAPVTSWRFYDSIYTERYMRTPQENSEGYDANSPLNYANKLKGKLLLVHGSGDDNVHVQNTMRFSNALIKANKPFEQAIYADRTHGIYRGKNTRLHLFTKMTRFIKENLTTKNN